ncbi:MAG: NAD(P)H-hydrate dehydratase, partial [Bacteroidetes bacterium]|nr:NAD(P)H-hydrate dehydratase [Bacteroidota bacterium]
GPRDIETDRVESVRAYARATRSAVILKGVPTATASSDGTVILNSTGNPGMATVGSGDVLAGIVAGLWAQGMEQHAAAWCAAFVHGLSGDIAAERMGERSLVAGDLIEYLPKAFARIETGRHE